MSEVILTDHSSSEESIAHQHPTETLPQGSQADGLESGHEHRDIDAGNLAKLFALVPIAIIIALVVSWGFMTVVENHLAKSDTLPSQTFVERPPLEPAWPVPLSVTPLQSPSAVPEIEPNPEQPFVVLRESEDQQLATYGWIKNQKGQRVAVRLPIDRAMDLIAERGEPTDDRTKLRPDAPTGGIIELGETKPSELRHGDQIESKPVLDVQDGKFVR